MDVNEDQQVKRALSFLEEKLSRFLDVSVDELRKMKVTYTKGELKIKE